ncbi:MAG: hypothetical protein ABR497_00020 [Kiritimatiellia bacterium]|nr:hypothetical protein [Lentisphaerota bacterium]
MRYVLCLLATVIFMPGAGIRADPAFAAVPAAGTPTGYLARLLINEHDIEAVLPDSKIKIWLVDATPADLDPGDRSQLIKMGLPIFNLRILLKKTDYHIEELDIDVRGDNFKIIEVARHPAGVPPPDDAVQLELDVKTLKDYLLSTRSLKDPLHPHVDPKLRNAILQQIAADMEKRHLPLHEAHVAPLSPVANELWIFWETGRQLIRVAADMEITHPAILPRRCN